MEKEQKKPYWTFGKIILLILVIPLIFFVGCTVLFGTLIAVGQYGQYNELNDVKEKINTNKPISPTLPRTDCKESLGGSCLKGIQNKTNSVKILETPKQTDCKESHGGSCLKVIQSSWRHTGDGSKEYDRYEIIGEIKNVGTGTSSNVWHGIDGSCYANGKLVNVGGAPFKIIAPGETTTFSIGINGYGEKIDYCKVEVDY